MDTSVLTDSIGQSSSSSSKSSSSNSSLTQLEITQHSCTAGIVSTITWFSFVSVFGFGTKKSRPSPRTLSFHFQTSRTGWEYVKSSGVQSSDSKWIDDFNDDVRCCCWRCDASCCVVVDSESLDNRRIREAASGDWERGYHGRKRSDNNHITRFGSAVTCVLYREFLQQLHFNRKNGFSVMCSCHGNSSVSSATKDSL